MTYLLAADIGGTKTLFQLATLTGEVVLQQELSSQRHDHFDEVLRLFLQNEVVKNIEISAACFALAGPVDGAHGRVTKLPWKLDAKLLAKQFQIGQVLLCNDFEAVGYGIACLDDDDIETIHTGKSPSSPSVRAVIGAGTGLGQAILLPDGEDWRVLPTEGGHVDFAPTDQTQRLFWEQMMERFGHVSYDRVVCGSGLGMIYHFLRDYQQVSENEDLRLAMINNDSAATISRFALEQQEPLACEAMKMFFKIYGAQAGNLALACMAKGGVYLAGGIAPKNLNLLKQSEFMSAFLDKGRMQDLMMDMSVHVVMDQQVGLKGAMRLAEKAYN